MTKFRNYLFDNYHLVIGFIFALIAPFVFFETNINNGMTFVFLAFASLTVKKEIREDVELKSFLLLGIPFIIFLIIAQTYGYSFWGKIIQLQKSKDIVIDLNPIFKNIPFNDAAFARIYQPKWFTTIMRFVYNNGFVMPAIIPIYRAAIGKDFKKMLQYAFSAHIFQIFLISPFYATFHLQEVWYVLNEPDGLARNFTPDQAAGWTLNCFPSMHTSIAFAMFLLVLREKDKIFKWVWGTFCISVIFSTMYLEVHWVIDVIAGLVLAYATVKLVDLVMKVFETKVRKRFFATNL